MPIYLSIKNQPSRNTLKNVEKGLGINGYDFFTTYNMTKDQTSGTIEKQAETNS